MRLTYIQADSAPSGIQTLFQLVAPTNAHLILEAIILTPQGSTGATAAVLFDFGVQTTTGTSVGKTWVKRDPIDAETAQSSILADFSGEPGATTPIYQFGAHQQAPFEWRPPEPGNELIIRGGVRWGLRYLASPYVDIKWQVLVKE